MLPIAKGRHESPWETFAQAKAAFDLVVPYQTSQDDLHSMDFSPYENPNIEIVSYTDIITRFVPNSSFRMEDLPEGIRACIKTYKKCYGYELKIGNIVSKRYGNTLLDLLNFKRKTHKTGWKFNALYIINDNQVVYKLWSGKPKIDEYSYKKNPLGPVQQSEDVLNNAVIETSVD